MCDEKIKCPFCGDELEIRNLPWFDGTDCFEIWHTNIKTAVEFKCPFEMGGYDTPEDAVTAISRAKMTKTCTRVEKGKKYGSPKIVCSVCGYGLGDSRWFYCPKCGSLIAEKGQE